MGAGGGGCVLVLVREAEEVLARVTAALEEHYYGPLGRPAEVEPWVSVAPAGEVDFASVSAPYERLARPRSRGLDTIGRGLPAQWS